MINQTYRKNKKVLNKIFYYTPWILQTLIWPGTRLILKFFGHLEIKGLENLKNVKKGQGIIFASNHTSELDPILLPASLPFLSRAMPLFYTSREKSFYQDSGWRQIFYGGFFFKLWGAHPLRPGIKNYEKSLETHIRLVEEGKSLLIFPEGRKTRDGLIHPENARGGLGFMAEITNKIVIPLCIQGCYDLSLKDLLKRKRQLKITLYPPVKFIDYTGVYNTSESNIDNKYKIFSRKILEIISAL